MLGGPKDLVTERFRPEISAGCLIFRSFNFSVRLLEPCSISHGACSSFVVEKNRFGFVIAVFGWTGRFWPEISAGCLIFRSFNFSVRLLQPCSISHGACSSFVVEKNRFGFVIAVFGWTGRFWPEISAGCLIFRSFNFSVRLLQPCSISHGACSSFVVEKNRFGFVISAFGWTGRFSDRKILAQGILRVYPAVGVVAGVAGGAASVMSVSENSTSTSVVTPWPDDSWTPLRNWTRHV
jgi:hypothetical protein